ncbi:uncharacterized protein si:dkey-192g7.3 [Onychostoma macrolepis]|uniref:Ig-like domain-containing protein n=1 Tax=Onychostoma macrolepis TaxID=369639 RepID=A0A7J6CT59_9TELE|nr:uncharacterized protein si:dkey-192g7.3 [Onychostoma macrolepis]XP_058642338.1 uncharacterized protein si:dkey-192g7.3 [Onychostoma macrolepis]KAF4108882.1 hypothetical protein G5714_009955 [Onychostoma macrolepis]
MKTFALLTLLLIMSGSAVGQTLTDNLTGYVGMDVLLSINCSNDPKELVWQKGDRVVNVHPQDKSIIDDSYVDRTQLFINKENRNCSLLLRNISATDAGLYTCHALVRVDNDVWSSKSKEVNLTVSEMENDPEKHTEDYSVTAVSVSVPILLVMLILAVSLLLTLLMKRHHRRNTDIDSPAEKPMLQHV